VDRPDRHFCHSSVDGENTPGLHTTAAPGDKNKRLSLQPPTADQLVLRVQAVNKHLSKDHHGATTRVHETWIHVLSAAVVSYRAFKSIDPDVEVEMGVRLPTQKTGAKHHHKSLGASLWSKLIPVGLGLVSFVVTELMHYLLVPDIGRLWERLLAEGLSSIVVALLAAGLMHQANQRREAALLRMQVIAEMNHHIRNALAAISLSTDAIQNQQSIRVISESVDRITWALREILPRRQPLPEEDQERLFYLELTREKTLPNQHANEIDHAKSREEITCTRQA
jgi:signal transduction histidine kinase